MKTIAFADAHDGYYETQIQEGSGTPSWASNFTPCEVRPGPQDNPAIAINSKLRAVREVREAILNRLGGIALAAQLTGGAETVAAYLAARQSLLDITKDLPSDLADIELVVFDRYHLIVNTAQTNAPALVSAFAGVDL